MITVASEKLAVRLCKYIDRSTDVDYLRYGIEIIIRGTIKFLALLTTAYILGVIYPMIFVFFTFVFFRFLTGGHHYSTYIRCLTVGLIMIVGISYVVNIIGDMIDTGTLIVLLISSTLFGIILIYKYAPSNHFYKKFTTLQKKKLKQYAIATVVIWSILLHVLIFGSFSTEPILASILGFIFQIGSIHPFSYLVVNKIERLIERRRTQ
ncbi:accessory gene regulator B family protein [Aquibacillus koreensis]|uniref:Accessory gene regulator B family protein n=1 Tax=Aquibacillus koreensis TaxID=279446 RepID=A0A9X4AH73_9BACI|nr:accessory gene regulator B family protein [Aquibacillus koreensis]MCT2534709.1 accessory gene regulator B family protein [Aquibacillus koreensis]MDC3419681.1 accessory gene regulator B family protein [Aquibacillus koreensis]